jgi:Tfp pilus assembly PilM family ATPase
MTEEAVGGIRGEKISEEIETSIRFYSREGDADSLSNLFLFGEAQMAELVSSLESRFHLKVQFLDPQTLVAIDGFSSVKQEEIPLLIPALAAALGR